MPITERRFLVLYGWARSGHGVAVGMNVCPDIGQNPEDIIQCGCPVIGNTVAADIDGCPVTGIINTIIFSIPFGIY
jgi:hypothetical protein